MSMMTLLEEEDHGYEESTTRQASSRITSHSYDLANLPLPPQHAINFEFKNNHSDRNQSNSSYDLLNMGDSSQFSRQGVNVNVSETSDTTAESVDVDSSLPLPHFSLPLSPPSSSSFDEAPPAYDDIFTFVSMNMDVDKSAVTTTEAKPTAETTAPPYESFTLGEEIDFSMFEVSSKSNPWPGTYAYNSSSKQLVSPRDDFVPSSANNNNNNNKVIATTPTSPGTTTTTSDKSKQDSSYDNNHNNKLNDSQQQQQQQQPRATSWLEMTSLDGSPFWLNSLSGTVVFTSPFSTTTTPRQQQQQQPVEVLLQQPSSSSSSRKNGELISDMFQFVDTEIQLSKPTTKTTTAATASDSCSGGVVVGSVNVNVVDDGHERAMTDMSSDDDDDEEEEEEEEQDNNNNNNNDSSSSLVDPFAIGNVSRVNSVAVVSSYHQQPVLVRDNSGTTTNNNNNYSAMMSATAPPYSFTPSPTTTTTTSTTSVVAGTVVAGGTPPPITPANRSLSPRSLIPHINGMPVITDAVAVDGFSIEQMDNNTDNASVQHNNADNSLLSVFQRGLFGENVDDASASQQQQQQNGRMSGQRLRSGSTTNRLFSQISTQVSLRQNSGSNQFVDLGNAVIPRRQVTSEIISVQNGLETHFEIRVHLKQTKLTAYNYKKSPQGQRPNVFVLGRVRSHAVAVAAARNMAPPLWAGPEDPQICTVCHYTFALLRPGHHCRNCGYLVCTHCSSKNWPSTMIPNTFHDNEKFVRVCDTCHYLTEKFADSLRNGNVEEAKAIFNIGNINLHTPYTIYEQYEYPVHCVAQSGNVTLMKWFLEELFVPLTGADGSVLKTATGLSVLAVAAKHGRREMMEYLVTNGLSTVTELTDPTILWKGLHAAMRLQGPLPNLVIKRGKSWMRRTQTTTIVNDTSPEENNNISSNAVVRARELDYFSSDANATQAVVQIPTNDLSLELCEMARTRPRYHKLFRVRFENESAIQQVLTSIEHNQQNNYVIDDANDDVTLRARQIGSRST